MLLFALSETKMMGWREEGSGRGQEGSENYRLSGGDSEAASPLSHQYSEEGKSS